MSDIDKKIVEMRFENQQFEKGVTQSTRSLESLKQSLNMDGAARGLMELDRVGKSVSLASIADGVDHIASKFSALSIIGITALQNLANAAINVGSRIASALTIDPIRAGFNEYELKMNSVQTILANTQSRQKEVSKEAVAAINANADAALKSVKTTNSSSLDDTRKTYEKKIREYQKAADAEIDTLNDKYDKEKESLEKLIKAENKALKEAHEKKLEMYDEEYMSKLKVLDEDRYNQIKAIDDQIDAINGKTKAEEEALEKQAQKEKIKELEKKIRDAKDREDRKAAEKALSDYKDSLVRKELLAEREKQIDALKAKKESIDEEFDKREEALKEEYNNKVKMEKEFYDETSDKLKEQQDEKEKQLRKSHELQKKQIQERHSLELQALRDQQSAATAKRGGGGVNAAAIEARRQAQLKELMSQERGMTEGSTLEDVNKALAELNTYADKTIYNFAEMTRNIGTFTAAGVDLDTSVASIKGIANLAALSGSNAQQASTAMYQLSQAIASGSVKLQDWNSVVNAGMGGQVFQDALKETARVHGIAIDEIIASEGSFRESLQKGWLSSEILTETLSKFTGDLSAEELKMMGYTEKQIEGIMKMGEMATNAATKVKTFTQLFDTLQEAAQSGWATSWEIIIGDFEESQELLTNISNVVGGFIGSMSDARNEALSFWKDNGGRTAILDGLTNSFNALLSVLSPITQAFRSVFPPITGTSLVAFSEGFRDLTEKFKIGETTANNLKRTFSGLFSILDIGRQALLAAVKIFGSLVSAVLPVGDGLLGVTAYLGDFATSLNNAIERTGVFNTIANIISGALETLSRTVSTVVKGIISGFETLFGLNTSHLKTISNDVSSAFNPLQSIGETVSNTFSKMGEGISNVIKIFAPLGAAVGSAFSGISSSISNTLSNADFNSMVDLLNGGLLAGILLGIRKFIDSLTEITDGAGGLLDGITGILDGVKDSLAAYQSQLKAKTLLTIAGAIAILSAALVGLSLVDSDKLTNALVAVTVMFTELFASMAIFEKIMGSSGFTAMGKVTTAMIALSTAILILSKAVETLAGLDWNGLAKGLTGVAVLSATLVVSAKSLSDSSGKLIKGVTGLIAFAIAINILAEAITKMAVLDVTGLTKGLVGVGVLMTELSLFMNATDIGKMGVMKSVGILILASSLVVMADAVNKIAQIDTAGIATALTAMGVIFTEIAIFTQKTSGATNITSTAVGMTILGAAMLIFAQAIAQLGGLSMEEIGKGLLAMAGALTIIAGALAILPKNMIAQGAGLVVIATSLNILASALNSMGNDSWDGVAKSLVVLAGSLTIIATAMQFMTTALPGAAALLVISGALAVLAPVLTTLGNMSTGAIIQGLLSLVGVFGVFGGASALLSPLIPAMLGVAGAVALLGAGCLAAGAGVLAFSTGITGLAVASTAGTAAIVAMVSALVGLIPYIANELAKGIVEFIKILGDGCETIGKAVEQIAIAILDIIIKVTPKLMDAILVLLEALLQVIVQFIPKVVQGGIDLLLGLLKGIADNIQKVVQTAMDVVINFIKGVSSKLPEVIQAGVDLIISFIDGLSTAITANTDRMITAINTLFLALVGAAYKTLTNSITTFTDHGFKIIKGISSGVTNNLTNIKVAFNEVIKTMTSKLSTSVTDFVDAGKDIVAGIIKGIKSKVTDIAKTTADMAKDALTSAKKVLGIHSPSREFEEVGRFADEGLVNGLLKYASRVRTAGAEVGNTATNSLRDSLSDIARMVDGDMDVNPTIRPVLDMTDIQAGANKIGKMLDGNTVSLASSVASSMSRKETDTNQEYLLSKILEILSQDPEPSTPNSRPPIIFNINAGNNNPKEISRQIRDDLIEYDRSMGWA